MLSTSLIIVSGLVLWSCCLRFAHFFRCHFQRVNWSCLMLMLGIINIIKHRRLRCLVNSWMAFGGFGHHMLRVSGRRVVLETCHVELGFCLVFYHRVFEYQIAIHVFRRLKPRARQLTNIHGHRSRFLRFALYHLLHCVCRLADGFTAFNNSIDLVVVFVGRGRGLLLFSLVVLLRSPRRFLCLMIGSFFRWGVWLDYLSWYLLVVTVFVNLM